MKYVLITLLLTNFFVQAEDLDDLGGFFIFNVGMAVDNKLTIFDYPFSFAYGGNISKDKYAGAFEAGLSWYRSEDEFRVPVHLSFKYAYDFINFRLSHWGIGIDTALHLGGATRNYVVKDDGTVVEEGSDSYDYDGEGNKEYYKHGIELYIGHDLGLFVKRRIATRYVVLLRAGINNAWVIQSAYVPVKSGGESEENEEIKITGEFLNPNFYLGTGIQWYF